jgi:exodeoxyribonuclease VII small subunit
MGDIGSMSFEDALGRLESIVKRLENGEASLEESIVLYEEGVKLKQHCEGKLETASARIQKLQLGPDGQPAGLTSFDAA